MDGDCRCVSRWIKKVQVFRIVFIPFSSRGKLCFSISEFFEKFSRSSRISGDMNKHLSIYFCFLSDSNFQDRIKIERREIGISRIIIYEVKRISHEGLI